MTSHLELLTRTLNGLSTEEQQTLVTLLRKLERGLDTCHTPNNAD